MGNLDQRYYSHGSLAKVLSRGSDASHVLQHDQSTRTVILSAALNPDL